MSDSIWNVESLKQHFEALLSEKEKAYDQRFKSQEENVKTVERNRDTAIKKAEDSIEKKSDAVYVKFTGLQKTLTEVMLRPEIESRLKSMQEKIDDVKDIVTKMQGSGAGMAKFWGWAVGAISLAILIYNTIN